MEIVLPTYVLGPIFLTVIFLLCTVFTIGVKVLILHFKPEKQKNKIPVTVNRKKRKRKPKPKQPVARTPLPQSTFRSIEIDPEQVDRIYVKKIS